MGVGNRYLIVILLMARLSTHMRQVSSFFDVNKLGPLTGSYSHWCGPSTIVLPPDVSTLRVLWDSFNSVVGTIRQRQIVALYDVGCSEGVEVHLVGHQGRRLQTYLKDEEQLKEFLRSPSSRRLFFRARQTWFLNSITPFQTVHKTTGWRWCWWRVEFLLACKAPTQSSLPRRRNCKCL